MDGLEMQIRDLKKELRSYKKQLKLSVCSVCGPEDMKYCDHCEIRYCETHHSSKSCALCWKDLCPRVCSFTCKDPSCIKFGNNGKYCRECMDDKQEKCREFHED